MSVLKVRLLVGNNCLEVEGDSEVVEKQIDKYKDFIFTQQVATKSSGSVGVFSQDVTGDSGDHLKYSSIFDKDGDGNIKIIADKIGTKHSDKTRNLALLLCYASSLNGEETISVEKLRKICVDHGCYDSKNFISYIKGCKGNIVITGKNSLMTLKLTMPGKTITKELIEKIRSIK